MTTLNRARLLSVVKGDWSPYTTVQHIEAYLGPAGTPTMPIDIVETDFGLLAHDIHVVLHESGHHSSRKSTTREQS